MAVRVALHHVTRYTYDRHVGLSPHVVRLRPAPHCRTPVTAYSLRVTPEKHFINWQQDPHGNFLARFVFPEKATELAFEVDLVAELSVINPFDFFLEPDAVKFPFTYESTLKEDLRPFLAAEGPGPALAQLIQAATPKEAIPTNDFLVEVNRLIHNHVRYVIRLEPGVQACEETASKQSGSCRDSAWLLVQLLRNLGLAARFVSGYLIQLKPDVKSLDGPSGTEVDFTDLHAWTEVYLPGAGWIGLDPTSGLFTGEGHLPLAATPDPFSAAPITGGVDPCECRFEFSMTIERVHEDPRVTKPYTPEQWDKINALGHQVDSLLAQSDVRLTMGGEPTFVSIDDPDAAEWNTAALGPAKRRQSGELFNRMAKQFANGPLLHYGQGKWYPGEQLPRWALACYWRKDGQPLWHDPQWIAQDIPTVHYTAADAETFMNRLAENLGVSKDFIIPGYEDSFYYLWRERRLPSNVDPLKSNLSDPQERARLTNIFARGLSQVTGYTLPVRASWTGHTRWESGSWFLRNERMYLLPGDSAMGFRLPLDSLPWSPVGDLPILEARDPLAFREPLPTNAVPQASAVPYVESSWELQPKGYTRPILQPADMAGNPIVLPQQLSYYPQTVSEYGENGNGSHATYSILPGNGQPPTGTSIPAQSYYSKDLASSLWPTPAADTPAPHIVRTALCIEPRDGILHCFLPPIPLLEDYLELVSCVEKTAADLQMPIRLEGYTPPYDYRLDHFKITPDPGVIEVNLQPASNWSELSHLTTTLYEEARQTRLSTEKFMVDGRHTGTGGGNHLVLGGPTPSQSPMLRRPDLLASLVGYWNNHPSLSYLFSGLFIGPTSQAPRVDEARHENLYELETAIATLNASTNTPPWLVDRIFRHLLIDLTGNTHRAEICIDKLYSPDSSTGRLGLVEFRGFEMPPHPQMSLAQQLVLRALVAHFWQKPYKQKLVRWGTQLHDKFMLPHFVAHDFSEVLNDLRSNGLAFDEDWFDPHFEFRFPRVGTVTHDNVYMELRQAMEPWHVLGEEGSSNGTARYVDSSIERLQVKVRGFVPERHVVLCNGRRVPLHPTGTRGEFVAGVRYRAWQPPSCLHPTIPVDVPLVFDLFDRWTNRALGGCTWNVAHPGGRSYDTFPVNAYEAESRRANRFSPLGHTPGTFSPGVAELNPDYPFTLDLRRPLHVSPLGNE